MTIKRDRPGSTGYGQLVAEENKNKQLEFLNKFQEYAYNQASRGKPVDKEKFVSTYTSNNKPQLKVSVLMTNYNGGQTLRKAINSVLQQVTNFDFEIVIMDDASTDNSREVIEEFKDPRIRAIFGCHLGMAGNYSRGFKACVGEYVAICDDDDYWIATHKLQEQVDYMDRYRDCGMCVTRIKVERNGVITTTDLDVDIDTINSWMTFQHMLRGHVYISAQTYLIRMSDFHKYVDLDKYIRIGFNAWDFIVCLELIRNTRIHCLDTYSAVYVISDETFSHTNSRKTRLKYILGVFSIRAYFMLTHGFTLKTLGYLTYRFSRDIYSIIFKRWVK